MDIAQRIIGIITPVLIISAIGYAYGRLRKPDMSALNRLNADLLFPLLIYTSMASKDFNIGDFLPLIGGGIAVVFGSGLIAWGVARWLNYNPRAFVPSMMFTNVGNMGLPLALLAFGPEMLPAAVALSVVVTLLHFSLGIRIIAPDVSLKHILRGPMLWASVGGIVSSLSGFSLPAWLGPGARMLGDTAIPLGLFTVGVGFATFKVKRWSIGIIGAILCPVSGLIIAWPLAHLLPLSPPLRGALLLNAALPPAVMNFILAEHYQQEPGLVSAIVMVGSVASIFFVPLSLYLAF